MAQPECIISSLNVKSSAVPNKPLSILKGINQLGFVERNLKKKKKQCLLPHVHTQMQLHYWRCVCSLSSWSSRCVCKDDSRARFSSHRVPVTVGSLLDDQHWHSVHIERFNKQVNLTVDSYTQRFQTKGEGHSLEVDYEVSPCADWITDSGG